MCSSQETHFNSLMKDKAKTDDEIMSMEIQAKKHYWNILDKLVGNAILKEKLDYEIQSEIKGHELYGNLKEMDFFEGKENLQIKIDDEEDTFRGSE